VRELSDDEQERLLAACSPALRQAVIAALMTGMRQAELLTLRHEQVNLDTCEIVLTRTKSNRVRRVPVAEPLVPVLEVALKTSVSGVLFEARAGEAFTGNALRAAFRRALERAKVEGFRFHDLRHCAASALRRGGADLDVIRRVLGHSSLAMTLRYAHIGDGAMRSAMDSLPAPRLRLVK
jgi:integrase